MRNIILVLTVTLFSACSSGKEELKPDKNMHKEVKYYALEEFKYKNFSDKDDKTLDLLENKKLPDYAIQKKSIILQTSHTSFYELLQNKNFFKQHFVDDQKYKDMHKLIFHKNKALVYFSGESLYHSTLCVFSSYYLLKLNKNKIIVTYISGGHGEIMLPPDELAKYIAKQL